MYTNEKKNGRLINLVLGIIAIIIIIFVIIWIINKGHTSSRNAKMFDSNLTSMQETANEYFSKNLPEMVGQSYKVSLKEMYALGLSDKLYYGNDACNADESYISITKTSATEYKVKSNLKCSNKEDSKSNTIKVNAAPIIDVDTNTNTNTNTIIDVDTNTNTNTNANTGKTNTNTNTCSTCNTDVNCQIASENNCTITYKYEYVARTYGCPAGYSETNDGRCVKTTNIVINPNTSSNTIVKDPKKTNGSTSKVYTNAIVESGTETKYCTKGELKNGACYEYADKTSNTTYTYSCPAGYDKSGTGSNTKCSKSNIEYTNYNKTANVTYSCPAGYDKSGTGSNTKCSKTNTVETKYTIGYTAWGNPDNVFDSTTKIAVYEKELEKLIQTGSTCKTLFGTTTCTYAYAHYSRSYTYNCPADYTKSGSGTNTKCTKSTIEYANPTKTTTYTYTCPNSYSKSGSGDNTKCFKTTYTTVAPNKTANVTYSCPAGYTDGGSKCYKTSTPSVYRTGDTYSCPTGYTKENTGANTKCYMTVKTEGTYYCEDANAVLTNGKCVINNGYNYSCPSGFATTADGRCVYTA